MDKNILSFEEAAIWALYYKEKFASCRYVSVEEVKEYAKQVSELCKDMFDFDVKFKYNQTELKKLLSAYPAELKYVAENQTIKLKSGASSKWLLADEVTKRPVVLELDRALSDELMAKEVLCTKQIEKQ